MTRRCLRRSLASALLLVAAGASPLAGAAVETLEMTTPRPFGYVIGDTIEHRVSLVLDPGFELDPESIPEPGRASRWLALNESVLESDERNGTTRHSIRLRYQIVNAAESVIGAGTPPLSLRILGPEDDLPVVIPSWGFTFGPIVTHEDRIAGRPPSLRPALPPPPFETGGRTVRVAALGLLALALIVLIVRERLAGRFRASSGRHFDRAWRRLRRRSGGANRSDAFTQALVEVHAAFNATAGRAVFQHDLARFFVEHPRFEPVRTPIEAFFAESGKLLYGRNEAAPDTGPSLERLHDLCRACRDVERNR